MHSNAIDISALTVRYGNHIALDDINLEILPGTFNAIVGPNGSGKTTLIKALLGLLPFTSGRINVFGSHPDKAPAEWIGYVPQVKTSDRSFPALSIELVASGILKRWPAIISRKVKTASLEVLDKVGAKALAYIELSNLSGGELQRVFLARAIARNPRILLLDEPATGIDMVCEAEINRLISNMNKKGGTTIIMVTHNWETARHHAEYCLLLNKKLIAYDKTSTALQDKNLIKAFRHIGSESGTTNGEHYV